MMRCAIMQPTYLPWAGYFNLIATVDVFVFLDDVQFEKQSWQNRNRVLVAGLPHFLTVPVRRKSLDQLILEIEVDDTHRWREKHTRLISESYAKRPFGASLKAIIDLIANREFRLLADLNMTIILSIAERLDISTRFVRASELNVTGSRSERLVSIARHFNCETYLSPPGARAYLEADGVFPNRSVHLAYHSFEQQPYPQNAPRFISHLSIIDVLANLGPEATKRYVRGI